MLVVHLLQVVQHDVDTQIAVIALLMDVHYKHVAYLAVVYGMEHIVNHAKRQNKRIMIQYKPTEENNEEKIYICR
jgi:hypothetical protein